VACLQRDTGPGPLGQWIARGAAGQELARAPHVVVASALGSLGVLQGTDAHLGLDALPLRPVKGQMSLGELIGPPLAERPLRNNGVFVPLYEDAGIAPDWPTRVWSMGSTYHRGDNSTTLNDADHERNRDSLLAMHPEAAEHMALAARTGTLMGWAQVRCASLDRLPLMGAVPDVEALQARLAEAGHRRGRLPLAEVPRLDGLYMLSALGSRGLTLAHWCARQLATQMANEPATDVEADLLQALDPARFAWRQARKQGRVGA
jgi:tRNA 5-methylaminomethyl-2-thiouridine biosynthesis bifunctional protein